MREQTRNTEAKINEFRIMIVKMTKSLENKMEKSKNQLTKT